MNTGVYGSSYVYIAMVRLNIGSARMAIQDDDHEAALWHLGVALGWMERLDGE